MKFPVFCIRDKASCFMQPMVEMTEQTAVRNFARAVNEGGLQFQTEDYDLYKVGFFDDQSGELEHILPEFVVAGTAVKKELHNEVQ